MKEKFKKWFIKSALIDFQEGNLVLVGILYILLGVEIFEYSLIFGILYAFLSMYLSTKYNKLGRRYYYFGVCELHGVEAKTLNLKFN